MALGHNVKYLRVQRGWDQHALFKASGVPIGTISAMEVRDSKRSEYAPQLAAAFEIPLEVLFDEDIASALEHHKAAHTNSVAKGAQALYTVKAGAGAPTLAQALEVIDASLDGLDAQARRIAVGMLAALESPGSHTTVATMLTAAIASGKQRAA